MERNYIVTGSAGQYSNRMTKKGAEEYIRLYKKAGGKRKLEIIKVKPAKKTYKRVKKRTTKRKVQPKGLFGDTPFKLPKF